MTRYDHHDIRIDFAFSKWSVRHSGHQGQRQINPLSTNFKVLLGFLEKFWINVG